MNVGIKFSKQAEKTRRGMLVSSIIILPHKHWLRYDRIHHNNIVNYIYISICLQEFLHHHIQFTFNSPPFLPPLTVCSAFLASVVSSFLRREGIWVYINSEGKVSRERGEGSDWRWSLLHSLISCGWQGSRGCTGSFPLEGAWLNSTQFLSPGWIPGFASGSCRRELKSRKQVHLKKE